MAIILVLFLLFASGNVLAQETPPPPQMQSGPLARPGPALRQPPSSPVMTRPQLPQQPAQQSIDNSMAMRGVALAMQQIAVATDQFVSEAKAQLAAKDARIAELEKLCGDPCKQPSGENQ